MSKYADKMERSDKRHSKEFRKYKLGYPVERASEKTESVDKTDVKPEAPADNAITRIEQSIEKVCDTMKSYQQTTEARFKKTEEELFDIRSQLNELTRVTCGLQGQSTKLNAVAINHDERLGQMYTRQQVHQVLDQVLAATSTVAVPASAPVAPAAKPQPAPAPVVEPASTPVVEPASAPVVEPAPAPVVEPAVAPAPQPVPAPASTKKSETNRYVGSKKYYVIEDPFGVDGHKYDLCHPFEILDAEASGNNWATWKYWVREDGALIPYTLKEMRVSVLNSRTSLLN